MRWVARISDLSPFFQRQIRVDVWQEAIPGQNKYESDRGHPERTAELAGGRFDTNIS
jgi:hypothetical protein